MKQRILTGAVALPLLVLFLLYSGPWLFLGVMTVVQLVAQFEYQRMAQSNRDRVVDLTAVGLGTGCLILVGLGYGAPAWTFLALGLLLLFTLCLFRCDDLTRAAADCGLALTGVLYLSVPLAMLVLLFASPGGRLWVFFVLLTVMMTDTFALFVGRQLGRRPLYTRVSPNKSVEGALGGLAGGAAGGLVAAITFFPLPVWFVLPVALVLSAVGQVGDLFESMLKRSFGVKDSGTIIPGHGGLLDRLDSLLFAFPVAYGLYLFARLLEVGP
ncbi:MAG: phosphatidate cytidylyltransferase [Deltaproteobacteria bacterium]|nr:MAG: phosphatidate cytidylyltransferase [Deltaproteobacteria bacterium]